MSSATATRSSKYCLRVPSSEAIGQLFDRDMRLSIDDAVALLDCSAADGLGEMTLARARRTEQQHVFALTDKTRGCEIVDERAIHLLVEIEIKAVEGSVCVAESGQLEAAGEEVVLPSQQLVGHERRDEIDRSELVGLRLAQPRFEDVSDAGEPELAECVVEFGEVHVWSSPVFRWMSSR